MAAARCRPRALTRRNFEIGSNPHLRVVPPLFRIQHDFPCEAIAHRRGGCYRGNAGASKKILDD